MLKFDTPIKVFLGERPAPRYMLLFSMLEFLFGFHELVKRGALLHSQLRELDMLDAETNQPVQLL